MKRILFHFPLRYYLNPVNILGAVFMLFVEYTKWQSLSAKIAEFEAYNVKHYHNQFELIPSTVLTIIWITFNILLYPYVFDAILRVAGRFFGSNILFRGMVRNTITIYKAELERGDIYTHHEVTYNSYGYPVGVVPKYDRAKPRAITKASDYLILRLSLTIVPVMLFILALWGGWMLSIIIGWFFAYRFHTRKE
ncbi:TPA: hypothetical protein TVG23_001568 [Streptococcus equi subsp. zooepidemicus]|nr:hypothetical protein [Streptococcus equi subsp. zooepidemicus]HEL1104720.1 hypothetical protein [Streptococcus equi subsp. zooepidemicus]